MLAGWLAAGADPSRFSVLTRTPKQLPDGVQVFAGIEDAVAAAPHDRILLGFKPHQLGELAEQVQSLSGPQTEIHSLLAGITLDQLQAAVPKAAAHLRVMPNLACEINKSPVILCECGLDESAREGLFELYDQLGTAVWLEGETHFDLVTALAGSGPGFVYRFIDALAEAAIELGLPAASAHGLALATVEGAAALATQAEFSPRELADRVASPGGMTREGLNVLDEDAALKVLLVKTLAAARDRGAALSQDAG